MKKSFADTNEILERAKHVRIQTTLLRHQTAFLIRRTNHLLNRQLDQRNKGTYK